MDNKKYAWTRNAEDDIWESATFDSVKECVEDARGCGIKPGEQIAVGICEPYEPQINAEQILDNISEDAYEKVGEVAEGWPYFKRGEGYEGADTLQERMQKVFMEWLKETNQIPSFYHIYPLADLVTITEE